ncbi:mannosyl-glycoprotein endo-beta-N-acetylglucosaminidase [Paenibacillus anaericanus]|uniref:endo-beta-N-acetylglucosaminidase n=1 Tax=Paenibacillus anaericanus TaxID=170367 RepID=UPI00277D4D1C|nr:discoidin domain-containing protein [Paenibacillus anaericanus]MDQ0087947.1 mannosyl-glycoprotein endo-beta-N-acetylglucosaminidase [Paenibacillus anaericanus]
MKKIKPNYFSRSQWKKKCALLAGSTLLAVSLFAFADQVEAAQPHSSYWYPNTLLKWSPDKDPDAIYNRGSVKLQEGRVIGDKVNEHAKVEPKVIALSSMYSSTSGAPSQGSEQFHTYTFSYWQYIDKLVMWGGSAGEGLIVPPSADVIDAAHKNGVPVYGTIFLPQTEHGGKIDWMHDLLAQREDGSFPVGDKLIEVANYYGFDGWFINQETQGGTPQDAQNMEKFLKYLQQIKGSKMEIIWYDSMIDEGPVKWQGSLTNKNEMFFQDKEQRVSDNLFIDFRWQYKDEKNGKYDYITPYLNSPAKAKELGRSPYDLYAGIDVEAEGYEASYNWPLLFPDGKAGTTSLGIYRPDWAFNSSKNNEEYMEKEQIFWVGNNKNPEQTDLPEGADPLSWRGIAHDIVDKTVLTGSEFITHFNTGNGHMYAVNGKVMRDTDWSNRSLQDILPTWRWITESVGSGSLKPSFDFSKAYYGGSSLKVEGDLKKDSSTHLKLYKANMPVEATTELSVIYQANSDAGKVKIGAAFSDAPDQYVFFEPKKWEKVGEDGVWRQGSVPLDQYKGRKIVGISLKFEATKAKADYVTHIGQLSVTSTMDQANAKKVKAVTALTVTENEFRDGIYGDARLTWNEPEDHSDVLYYQVYRVQPDGKYNLIGMTGNNVYYVPEMKRLDKELSTKMVVIPVSRHYQQGKGAAVSFNWPKYPQPIAAFEAEQTLIAPGDTVQLTDLSSEVTEQWNWSFPGGEPSSSTERNPKVTYGEEGNYEITLTAKNSVGEHVLKKKLITVTKEAANGIVNLALGKTASASSFVNENEGPKFALDTDDKTKWCAVGDAPHTLTVDLGTEHKISEFIIKHAETGGEPAAFNTREFKIQYSSDGKKWIDAVSVNDNTKGVSKHAIELTSARYVRLVIAKPTQGGDTAARIYGFEVMGLK